MASVDIRSLSVRFPDGTAGLADVDLQVADGELVALVGPSGSGKTTLLRTIAGFLAPTSGTVAIAGEHVAGDGANVPPERRRLGMVFQSHAVWPHWDVGRNVAYPLRLERVPRHERAARVAEALELVGLPGAERRDPATLSGGQRQRVALARALVARPRVLLLDEALSALDEPLRDRLRLELRGLVRSLGLTVVHVTHDRAEALAIADRVVVLDGGRIQQVATPETLLHAPTSPFVARFLSDATVLAGTRTTAGFVADGGGIRIADAAIEGRVDGAAALAVLPGDVAIVADDQGDATVTSALFARDGSDVVLDWRGVEVRCTAPWRPVVGERVAVSVRRALAFAADAVAEPTEAAA